MTRADIIEKLLGRCAEVTPDQHPVLSDDDLLELLGRANEMRADNALLQAIDVPAWAAEIRAKVAAADAGRAVRARLETVPECSVCSVCGVPFAQPGKCWCGVATKEG